jgi:hypothetical protein
MAGHNDDLDVVQIANALEAEANAQMSEIGVPETHLKLIKHFYVLTRREAVKQLSSEIVAAGAVSNPSEGAICLIPDFRWDLAHEIGHLVWHHLLGDDKRASFRKLYKREREEYMKQVGMLITKFAPKMFSHLPARSERDDERFAWSYAFYLLREGYSDLYPAYYQWFKENVFEDK